MSGSLQSVSAKVSNDVTKELLFLMQCNPC